MKQLFRQKFVILIAAVAFVLLCAAGVAVYRIGFSDPSKVPHNALYKKASAGVDSRVADLLKRMTIDEKIGQMTQIVKDTLHAGEVKYYLLGSVLSGGGGSPATNTAAGWADMVDAFQNEALSTRLGIPIIYGVDAVHGHGNLANATVFPHNIGLGATGDSRLVEEIGKAVAEETAGTGILWNFGPCVAVAQDLRWGRTYESFGEDPSLVASLTGAYVRGYQSALTGSFARTVVSAKHFIGDGATEWGSSTADGAKIDQGDARGDRAYLEKVLLPPYVEAIKYGARTVMTSHSSWNGLKMVAQKDLITGILKGELGFTGFVVSDWGDIEAFDPVYYKGIVASINAGVDMSMVPYDARKFIATVKKAVASGDIPMARIDDAVSRILRVKFEMGLFESPKANRTLASTIRSPGHLALAREAVAKSLVLLKNDRVLPLGKKLARLYVAGSAADDIGIQCGGWTITWQGKEGKITEGTTILEGIKQKVSSSAVVYERDAQFKGADSNASCVVVVGEKPYAEWEGDNAEISLSEDDRAVIAKARGLFKKVIVVLISGRPLVLGSSLAKCDALVAAWLPGTEGAGIADVLFGDAAPTGKLPFDWPLSADQMPLERFASGEQIPLFPVGFGLRY